MMYQQQLQKALKEKQLIPQTLGTLIIFNSEQIVNGIKQRWAFGKSSDGGIIGQYRNSEYQAFKVQTNPRAGGNVDLTLTGALGNNLMIKKKGTITYEIISIDSKFKAISRKYGLNQFNLDQQQQDELFDMLILMTIEQYYENVWANV